MITRCVAYMGERVVRKKKRAKKACEWRGSYAGSKCIDHLAVSRGCLICSEEGFVFWLELLSHQRLESSMARA